MSSKAKISPIITDLSKFNDRVPEIESNSRYEEVLQTISKIKATLSSEKNYVCLCAPQIGSDLRLFVVKKEQREHSPESRYDVFLNPMIVSKKGLHLSREISLSIPGKEYIVPRYNEIHLAYQEKDGRVNSKTFIGAFAEVIQQMVEMLDGITLADYGLEVIEGFDSASNKEKQEIISMYVQYLSVQNQSIINEIEKDSELKNLMDTIKFNQGILDGSIKPIDKDGNIVEFNLNERGSKN